MRFAKWLVPVAALTILLSLSIVKAQDAAGEKGSIAVTVVGTDGTTPVAGATVKVFPGGKHGKHLAAGDKPAHEKPVAVAEGTTDADGKVTLKDVPAGDVMVMAMSKTPAGRGMEHVKVEAGKTVDAKITLKAKAPK